MIDSLLQSKGNPRVCMFTEPMWGVPAHLFLPFASVYMIALGLTETTIGLVATVSLVLQVFFSLLGGPLTDKYGRRRTTFISDIISWTIPTLLWAIAQNATWFYVAALINSVLRVPMTSWTCLFIEDAPRNRVVHFWTWVYIANIFAGFVAPLAGLMIDRWALIPTMRAIYGFAFLSMTAKFVILFIVSHETRQGSVRLRETADRSLWALVRESTSIVRKVFTTPGTLAAIAVLSVKAIYTTVRGTFFAVLLTEGLAFGPEEIGWFPALRSLVMLAFYFTLMSRLRRERFVWALILGFSTLIVSVLLLAVAPERGVALVVVSTVIEALGAALLAPYVEGFVYAVIDAHERARILAVVNTFVLAVASPFGWIAGTLSERAKIYPFLLIAVLMSIAVIYLVTRNPERGR
jgi:MFS family permease